ncbi:hypothetical protein [Novosphingobium sp. G106]|uniref:hypothetical protein n=1 Tax=Novosphingobium sp. G106 TaxID=2849500 RepID=UPI0020C43F0D|nr:hypothetical protein [Novosphingobium sp. G106]
MDDQMHRRRRGIGGQGVADERLQAELLAVFYQEQVGRHVGHEIGARQPGALIGVEPQRALREVQIDRDQRIA